jgi:hypothetical protein
MAKGTRPHEGPDGTVDLQAQENHRRLLAAQGAAAGGRVPFVHPAVKERSVPASGATYLSTRRPSPAGARRRYRRSSRRLRWGSR